MTKEDVELLNVYGFGYVVEQARQASRVEEAERAVLRAVREACMLCRAGDMRYNGLIGIWELDAALERIEKGL